MEWSFNTTGLVEARIEVPAGSVDVRIGSPDVVAVSLEPEEPGSRRGQELVDASTVSFEDGRLVVHVPSKMIMNAGVVCSVALPEGSSLDAKTASADLSCTGRLGDVSASVASGDITLETVDGSLELKSASGDLRCGEVGRELNVKGASSDVTVGAVGGGASIQVASGDVEIDAIGGSLRVNTASGDIRLRRASRGEVSAKTASGDIVIGVASGTNAYLDASSVTGEMKCTLSMDQTATSEADLRIVCRTASGDVLVEAASA